MSVATTRQTVVESDHGSSCIISIMLQYLNLLDIINVINEFFQSTDYRSNMSVRELPRKWRNAVWAERCVQYTTTVYSLLSMLNTWRCHGELICQSLKTKHLQLLVKWIWAFMCCGEFLTHSSGRSNLYLLTHITVTILGGGYPLQKRSVNSVCLFFFLALFIS